MKDIAATVLDDVERIRSLDPGNMYNSIFDMPEHMIDGGRRAQIWKVEAADFAEPGNMVLIGMGGSAIAGDLARSHLSSSLLVPFQICRHYELPEYVDDETVVIASSYSGNTEETISAVEDALRRKAMIAAITTGGLLQDVCELNQIPMCQIPEGLQPRAALGYSFVPLMFFLDKIGLVKDFKEEFEAIVGGLQKYREVYIEDNPTENNTAKNLAQRLKDKLTVIYTGPTLTDAVGVRFKGQISENAKQLAFVNHFSEFNHNELVGWSDLVKPFAEQLVVVMLRDAEDLPQIRTRMNIVKDIIKDHGVDVVELHTKGKSRLERMFSLVQLGDFISYYLAILNEIDPTPVKVIEELKGKLAEAKLPRV
jgi:glucose/mannose-6-phosphate isomerase